MSGEKTPLRVILQEAYDGLTAKGKRLADFLLDTPDRAVFMTTRQLAAAVGVSEATVVRFVRRLGYTSYALFVEALRQQIDTEFTLLERGRLNGAVVRSDDKELERITNQDIDNIRSMCKNIDLAEAGRIRSLLKKAGSVHVIGSRLSYAPAYYLGWTMAKVREKVFIHMGSDKTTIDRIIFAESDAVVVIVATSRYPNELIELGKLVKRRKLVSVLLTDSPACPLAALSDHTLFAPQQAIPFLGNPTSLISLINYLVHALAADMGEKLKEHQEKLEQAYRDNDILYHS